MHAKLTIKMDNAAFHEADGEETPEAYGSELARILRHLAERVAEGCGADDDFVALDYNGNKVGRLVIEEG